MKYHFCMRLRPDGGAIAKRLEKSRTCAMVAIVVALLFWASAAGAVITFDSSVHVATNATVISWQHTVGPGIDGILVVSVSIFSGNKMTTGITYGGVPLIFLGAADAGGGGANNQRVELWYLVAPAMGVADVMLTMAGGSKFIAGSASYFGVDPLSPTAGFFFSLGNSTSASITVPSASDQFVTDVIATNGAAQTLTPGAGQAELWNDLTRANGGNIMGAASYKAGTVSTSMSWTLGNPRSWVIGATSLLPVVRPFLVDAMIKLSAEPDAAYRFNAVYETTASLQIATDGAVNGTTVSYPVRFENDGFDPDQFVITGTAGDPQFVVQYLDGAGVDRTASVTGGGYTDVVLTLGASTVWTLRVTPAAATPGGSSYAVTITATSTGDPLSQDQVGAVTTSLSPSLTLAKVVDLATALPGQDLVYTIVGATAPGLSDATTFVLLDAVPGDVGFQIGSATFDPGTTSLTVVITYSNDNGATWTYTPASGSCGAPGGYDYCVTDVRWELSGLMPASRTFSASFVAQVR